MPTDPDYNPDHHWLGHADPLEVVAQLHDRRWADNTLKAWSQMVEQAAHEGLASAVEFLRSVPAGAAEQMLLTLTMAAMQMEEQKRGL